MSAQSPPDFTALQRLKKLFPGIIESEEFLQAAQDLLQNVSTLQRLLGSSGGIHVFADSPSLYHDGVLIGPAAAVLSSPTVFVDSRSDPGASLLVSLTELRERSSRSNHPVDSKRLQQRRDDDYNSAFRSSRGN